MYIKHFDSWNKYKKRLEYSNHKTQLFNEGEIWWCSLGVNLGSEQDGKNDLFERPVLILRKFNKRMLWALPITSVLKDDDNHHPRQAESVIISQVKLISSKRLQRFIESLQPREFAKIKDKFIWLASQNFKTPSSRGFAASLYPEADA